MDVFSGISTALALVGALLDTASQAQDFFNSLLSYLWTLLTFVGGITAAIGVFRWVSGGKSHDSQAQEGAIWVIALGGALIAIGVVAGNYLVFPTLS